jgi:dynactin-6
MASSKRVSIMPAPKPPFSCAPNIVIAENASLTGTHPISVGPQSVIHPRTKLNSTYAPITIGSSCIISERSMIGLQSAPSDYQTKGVVIGNGVVVEVGAVVEAMEVGEGCVIEVNARVGKGAVIGKVLLILFDQEIGC